MELLITRSTVPHFYHLEDGDCYKLEFENFGEHEIGQPTWTLKKSFPWEIMTQILHYLFYTHLSDHNYDLAASLCHVNRQFCKEIYNCVYGRSIISDVTRVKRISGTMYTLERIHDDYITMPRVSMYTACRIIKSGIVTKYAPWCLVLDCFSVPISGVVTRDHEPIKQFEIGSLNGDVVWLTGDYDKNGVFKCSRLKHPIINLEICNYADDNQITSLFLKRNKPFMQFVKLLIKCYGINTGIHVMFNDEEEGNPFDLSHTGFIEF
jgi:hypothetical protein